MDSIYVLSILTLAKIQRISSHEKPLQIDYFEEALFT